MKLGYKLKNQGHFGGPFLYLPLVSYHHKVVLCPGSRHIIKASTNDWIVDGYCFCGQHPGQYAPFKIQQELKK
ncbi:hypothetical protein C1N51_15510 [Vibrio campbellii]|nr:hypothetical protein C1N51_15510 [Vibrio campbellii]